MGNKQIPFDEVISGRVTARDKKLLKDSGYNVRDAVSFFLNARGSPKKKLLVDKHFIQEEICRLNKIIDDLKMDLIAEEMKLEEINNQLGIVELNGIEYSLEVSNAVNNIIQRYSDYSFDLDMYFQTNHLFVENQSALVDVTVEDLEALVKEKVSKQSL